MGFLSSRQPPLLCTFPHPECSFENKGSCQQKEIHHGCLAQGRTFNVSPKMEKRAQQEHCDVGTFFLPSTDRVAHPLLSDYPSPGACWKIIYCTGKWLTTQKPSRHHSGRTDIMLSLRGQRCRQTCSQHNLMLFPEMWHLKFRRGQRAVFGRKHHTSQ